ncbi:MAG: T9SS type A sorting domain-containing protein [Sphingobacteriales bacterium]|nr:MAG: T9SS type A sorting domain-containing protein [Sphingobacteriales bacterium]
MLRRICILSVLGLAGSLTAKAQEQVYDWSIKHKAQRSASLFSVQHIKTDKAGNVYTIGTFTDSIHIGGGSSTELLVGAQAGNGTGQYDYYLTKQDVDSNLVWIKRINKRSFRFNDIYAQPLAEGFEVDDNGNIFVGGSFPGTIDVDPGTDSLLFSGPVNVLGNAKSGFVARYNTDGELTWAKQIATNTVLWFAPYYRAASVNVNHFKLGDNGKLYVSGYLLEATAGDTLTYDPGGQNYQKVFTNTVAKNRGYWAVIDTADGTLENMKFVKGQQSGNMLRFKATPVNAANGDMYVFGQISDTFDIALEGQVPYPVNTLVTGSLNYNAYIARYDSAGAVIWANVMKAKTSTPIDFKVDAQGKLAFYISFADSVTLADQANYNQHYVQKSGIVAGKLNSNGTMAWEDKVNFALVNDNEYGGTNLSTDAFDNVYIAGTVKGRMLPNAVSSPVYSHAFTRKYKADGTFDWDMRYGNTSPLLASEAVSGNYVHVDASNNLYTSAVFTSSQFVINPLENTGQLMSATAPRSSFLAKYTCSDTSTTVLDIVTCGAYVYEGDSYTQSGTHKFHYWSDGGCDSFVVLNLTINTIDAPFITINNQELGVTSAYDTYQWLLDGQAIAGATQSTYTVTQNGSYQVVAGLANGCSDTSEVYEVTSATSIKRAGIAQQVQVFPNPSQGILNIKAPVAVQWELISIDGKRLQQGKGKAQTIVLSDYAEGVYLLKIADQDGNLVKTERVVYTK